MFSKKWWWSSLFALVVCAGCATQYQRESVFKNGYSDYRVGDDRFVVTFRANEHTSAEKTMRYAMKRAAELTLRHGYRYFAIIDQTHTGKHLSYPSLRLSIQCYLEAPHDREAIEAAVFQMTKK